MKSPYLQGLFEMFKADQGQWCKTNYCYARIMQAVTFSLSMNWAPGSQNQFIFGLK